MRKTLCAGFTLLLWLALGTFAPGQQTGTRAETLTIAGTGSSSPLISLLFNEFQKQAPETTLHLISPPLGSNGALKALASGRVDLVIVGRPISEEEFKSFGTRFDFADTPFIMASWGGSRRNGFTLKELAQVYEGGLTKWDTGAHIRLVLRGSFESDTLLLKTMSPELARAVALAAQRPGMAGAVNDIETAYLLTKTQGSLGPTTLGLLATMNLRLTVFPINGVAPTLENMKSGRYPWRKTLTVVLPKQPPPAARRFAEFLRSAPAQAVMLRNDYLPVAP